MTLKKDWTITMRTVSGRVMDVATVSEQIHNQIFTH